MKVTETSLPGVLLLEPKVFGDHRGFFMETFSEAAYHAAGIHGPFVQDNLSRSSRGVLRGLHFQFPHPQGKLVWVIEGEVLDVAVDIRVGSPNFGQWIAESISAENHRQMWVPPGFAHGFLVKSDVALLAYKCTDYYHPECERTIRWDDPRLAIDWPTADVTVSERDRSAPMLDTIPHEQLPSFVR